MIEELTFRRQTPTPPMDWLYHDEPDGNRIFKKEVYLGKNAEPWPECTNEEKEQWQRYNYEASEGMILIGVPQDLRDLNYDSASAPSRGAGRNTASGALTKASCVKSGA